MKTILSIALSMAFLLTGCANISPETKAKISTTLQVVEQQAMRAATQIVLNLATNAADGNAKANNLNGIASGLYANMGSIVTGDDVATIVKTWAPNNGQAYTSLAGQLASIYEAELKKNGPKSAAKLVQSIADGINVAAAKS